MAIHLLLLFLLTLPLSTSLHHRSLLQNGNVSCPMNFDLLRRLVGSNRPSFDAATACRYAQQGLRLVQADYLLRTSSFVPPSNTAESCWTSYQAVSEYFYPNFDLRRNCGYETDWIVVPGCMNITNRQQFESIVSGSSLNTVVSTCNQSLSGSSCSSCTVALSNLHASDLNGASVGNLTDCRAYPFIYAAAFVNRLGPTDRGTAVCLFSIDIDFSKSNNKSKTVIIVIIVVIVTVVLSASAIGFWYYRRKNPKKLNHNRIGKSEMNSVSALDSITGSTTLIKYTIEEVKEATRRFSRDNMIGKGGYGNVYKGVLPDGSEVALKRFKNCSVAGDASFTHEVELLSGRKALLSDGDGQPVVLADWAWSMVRNNTPLEVIDDGMEECGSPEVMEKYVLVAVLSSHPQLYARPTMDQVLKMLDMDLLVPSIPERPISLIAGIEDIERYVSSSESGQLCTPRGYQAYTIEMDVRPASREEEEEDDHRKRGLSSER
ncbi:hypothetical protein L1987_63631 [Smallanthus sonchifolius]|uniref:Uncharacterized protein n=1 Tax=Smallanthus sonchifolius TaxID=185202 RepID=A0ACB9CDT6_9ASTR|nr:hypothetical protein L1987_63631 [Smallanthus sonchifolius]